MQLTPYSGLAGPDANPETAPFWAAAREGRFVLPRCGSCGKWHWYPRAFCPRCYAAVELLPASGEGSIYTYTVVTGKDANYCLAYVALKEGPTMLTNIVADDAGALRIGASVKVTFHACANGEHLPMFRLSEDGR